jgi:SulP family sulfate permease
MTHRRHLFSLRFAHALREVFNETRYNRETFLNDLVAGLTVGIIAIPLSMALAIASGVGPQYGLYSAFIAGFLIPLFGGSRYSVSGPTAAFVVILFPVVQQYGLAGLLVATVLAGLMQILMGVMRLGRYIEYIPESVTLGFTGGIAIVIASLQLKDLLGLSIADMPEHFVGKIETIVQHMPTATTGSMIVGGVTLAVLLIWPRFRIPLPAHLPAVLVGTLLALVLNNSGTEVGTIASSFEFVSNEGLRISGIPPMLPSFEWPWLRSQEGEQALIIQWDMIQDLLSAAFAIAMLGAIESLLCAVVLDGMTGKKHSANSELMGQGIGNVITPFFGGITATAAIARSAANVKAGARTPIAAIIHALVVLVALVILSRWLGYLPMASMAALLVLVAWNMSEAPKAKHFLKKSPRADIIVFVVCLSLTVFFDMVIAITAGIVLASLLFMKNMADMTKIKDISHNRRVIPEGVVPNQWKVFKITGPLFFAAADRIFGELAQECDAQQGIVLYMDGVPILDAGGLNALNKFRDACLKNNTRLFLADFQFQPLKTLAKAGFQPVEDHCVVYSTLSDALEALPAST